MSMLLDALKKSEEQRQLGSTPDIHRAADHNPDGEGNTTLRWLPLLLGAVAVGVMGWLGWSQLRLPEGFVAEPVVAVAEPPVEGAGTTEPVDEAGRQSANLVEQYTSAKSGEAGSTAPEAQQTDQLRKDVSRSFNQYAAKTPAQKTPAGKNAAAGSSSSAKAAAPAEPPGQLIPQPGDSASLEPAESEPWEAGLMSYWALPQGVRDSLPEFRITVMVFADEPEDRFLLINGTRLKEQEELQSGVVLDEIRREGAVFRARNYRFLVRGG